MLIEDHDVRALPFEPPVLLCLQDLTHERQVVLLYHAHQQDRQVAGDAVRPETLLPEPRLGEDLRARSERPVSVEHARRQPFEKLGLFLRDAEVPQVALGMREGQGKGARGCAGIVVFLGEGHGSLPTRSHPCGERQPHEAAGREADALPQADDGVEHHACRP